MDLFLLLFVSEKLTVISRMILKNTGISVEMYKILPAISICMD